MITADIEKLSKQVICDITQQLAYIDGIVYENTVKTADTFRRHRVSEACFAATTGYGYNDKGRDVLSDVYADVMASEAAYVSAGIVSGTHAISAALFAVLCRGQTLLSVTGVPYDTLCGVIGIDKEGNPYISGNSISGNNLLSGSLIACGINYAQINLQPGGKPDLAALSDYINDSNNVGVVFIQRSRGYAQRRALTVGDIKDICACVHSAGKNITVMVDNCYGEFVETSEPGNAGADLIAGSLTKNPGGGLVPKGGYITGRKDLVEAAADRLTAPGLGMHCGAAPDGYRLLYQGLYMAPHTVGQALKTAVFSARLFELLGYETLPRFDDIRGDIVQAVRLGSAQRLKFFCEGLQAAAPVDAFLTPVASPMPGYDSPVIMAAGTFIQGATIEMTADAPLREPYDVFLQGALTFEAGKYQIMNAASHLLSLIPY